MVFSRASTRLSAALGAGLLLACGCAWAQMSVIGSYEEPDGAERMRQKVERDLGVDGEVHAVDVDGQRWYRVIAHAHVDHLHTVGYPNAWRLPKGSAGTQIDVELPEPVEEPAVPAVERVPRSLVFRDETELEAASDSSTASLLDDLEPLPPLPDLPELPPWPDLDSELPPLRRVELPESSYERENNSRLEAVDFILDELEKQDQ